MSAFSAAEFRAVAGHFATGVTVITGIDDEGPSGFTCQSFHALSLDPPMVLFAVAKTSTSWPRIRRTARCCVNVLATEQRAMAQTFATSGIEKFADYAWTGDPEQGCPVLGGVAAWFSCTIADIHPGGDHEVVTALVRAIGAQDKTPLVFHQGRYAALETPDAD